MHILYEWHTQLLCVCVCVCVCIYVCVCVYSWSTKTNKPYIKHYNKSPDSTVYWDLPCVCVTDAAEIKQVSWIILNVTSHSDSVPAGAPGLRSAHSQVQMTSSGPAAVDGISV